MYICYRGPLGRLAKLAKGATLWKYCIKNIKLKGTTNAVTCEQKYSHIYTHPGAKQFFLKVVMLHIKLKRMEQRAPCKHIFCPYKRSTTDGVKGKLAISHIKLKVVELRVHVLY